ncbi:hypothetical protein GOP47_0001984 [Adiantum capillus-veneris]|uniref:RING-type domain-containing protein n=1 Tax=Adiantum capillus-veneris TaxID=13818 RepID=A0A9D4ZQK4_ADICA|nr:hypothetical protein GOP47_0001984 [Adiantum capillus-veneris]
MASPAALSVVDSQFCHAMAGQDIASQASVLVKDASKRKRVNRKIKQCKLDARREQWLAQVTMSKHCQDGHQESLSSSGKLDLGEIVHPENHDNLAYGSRDIQHCTSEKFDKTFSRSHLHLLPPEHCGGEDWKHTSSPSGYGSCLSDCFGTEVSPKSTGSGSPKSKVKKVGIVHGQENRERFSNEINSKDGTAGHIRCIFDRHADKTNENGHESENEDWEAAADALGLYLSCENLRNANAREEGPEKKVSHDLSQASLTDCTIQRTAASCEVISRSLSTKAWMPDDAHRPASLPNLSKQQSLPAYFPGQNQQWVGAQKALQDLISGPSLCPICAEELDNTDSSFEPCACGFQLCLFCHHRIASEDGRCPGCRRFYSSSSTAVTLAPSSIKC